MDRFIRISVVSERTVIQEVSFDINFTFLSHYFITLAPLDLSLRPFNWNATPRKEVGRGYRSDTGRDYLWTMYRFD